MIIPKRKPGKGPRKRPGKKQARHWPKPELSRQGRINSRGGVDIILELNGERIGGVNVLKTYKDRAWLAGVWVKAKYRRRGHAKEIVKMAVKACKGKVKYVQGIAANKPVTALLKSSGFEFTKPSAALIESLKKMGVVIGPSTKFMRLNLDDYFSRGGK